MKVVLLLAIAVLAVAQNVVAQDAAPLFADDLAGWTPLATDGPSFTYADGVLRVSGDAYQVQMREISMNQSDNPLPLVNLYRHRVADGITTYERERVFALYTGVGAWQDFTIRVTGTALTVDLNGERVTEAEGLENARGYLGFQSEAGVIEYRNLTLREY